MTSKARSRHNVSDEHRLLRRPPSNRNNDTNEKSVYVANAHSRAQSKPTPSKHRSNGRRRIHHGHVAVDDDETEVEEGIGVTDDSDEPDSDSTADDEDADASAPSDLTEVGKKAGKKREMSSPALGPPTSVNQAGLENDHLVASRKRKRTHGSALLSSGDEGNQGDPLAFPRKRIDRKLSNNGGILKYDQIEAAALRALAAEAKMAQEALASDDDDEVYKQLDDPGNDSDGDSLMENPEDALLADSEADEDMTATKRTKDGSASDQEIEDPNHELQLSARIDTFFGGGGFLVDIDAFDGNDYVPSFLSEPVNPRRKSESSERRVRFQDEVIEMDSSTSSSSSSEFDVDTFPDLLDAIDRDPMVPQDSLDHVLLHQLEGDDDFDPMGAWDGSDGGGSEYDFGENEAAIHMFRRAPRVDAGSDGSSDLDSESLSGYDSDGDTTDDDVPTLQTISKAKTILHSPTRISQTRATPLAFPRNGRGIKRGPVMGTFQAVEGKPFAYYDSNTGRMRIISAPRRASRLLVSAGSSASNSPHVPYNGLEYESDAAIAHMSSSLFTVNPDIMISGVFGGPPGNHYHNGQYINGYPQLYTGTYGAPEAFFAQTLDSPSEEGSDYTTETNSSAAEIDVLSDFVHMERLDPAHTTDEGETEDVRYSGNNDPTAVSNDTDRDDDSSGGTNDRHPTTPCARDLRGSSPKAVAHSSKTARNLSSSMLAHFDRGVVGSFRNNQDRYRLLSQLPHGAEDATPLKAGKSAMDVMTPPRRRKGRRTSLK